MLLLLMFIVEATTVSVVSMLMMLFIVATTLSSAHVESYVQPADIVSPVCSLLACQMHSKVIRVKDMIIEKKRELCAMRHLNYAVRRR